MVDCWSLVSRGNRFVFDVSHSGSFLLSHLDGEAGGEVTVK